MYNGLIGMKLINTIIYSVFRYNRHQIYLSGRGTQKYLYTHFNSEFDYKNRLYRQLKNL